MISQILYWRNISKDRIFLSLLIVAVISLIFSLVQRQPDLERSVIPFQLTFTFFLTNLLFAFLTIRREPLLSYMFLTATILVNGTFYAFVKYLLLIQTA